jgi:26S proteasome regulatory subunit N8
MPTSVDLHPTVLLSVLDHWKRVIGNTASKQRVVGVLLGVTNPDLTVDVTNSFAVPFEEDDLNKQIWFLDHNYLENMFALFKKVTFKERIVGWYHTGTSIQPSDLAIHRVFTSYCPEPLLLVINPNPSGIGQASCNSAYVTVEEMEAGATVTKFSHLPLHAAAEEAEEIGVEHLLRNVKDLSLGDLCSSVNSRIEGFKEMEQVLDRVYSYLKSHSIQHKAAHPVNQQIVELVQRLLNLLPAQSDQQLAKALLLHSNDAALGDWMAVIWKAVIALHSLIDNSAARASKVTA